MAVGKGSLNRVVAKNKKNEIVSLIPNNVVDVDLSSISFKKATDIENLKQSIKAYGVILPVIVEETEKGLKVVDGVKRLSALKELGVSVVKAVVISADGKKINGELKKFEKQEKVVEKIVEKVVVKNEEAKKDDIHEEKFNAIKRLCEEEMPIYLL